VFVYVVAIIVTFLLISGLPMALVEQILSIVARTKTGIPIVVLPRSAQPTSSEELGWQLRPPRWTMSFAQTFEAAFNVKIRPHGGVPPSVS
jgi:hypothetical protein